MKFLSISQTKILGSSLALPVDGLGGSRATKRKIKSPQKNRAKPEKQKVPPIYDFVIFGRIGNWRRERDSNPR